MKHSPLLFSCLLAVGFSLSACDLGSNAGEGAGVLRPGIYRGDYPVFAQTSKLESELVLDSGGAFRYVGKEANAPGFMARGRWSLSEKAMVWQPLATSQSSNGADFFSWDSTPPPDTAYLRNVSDSSFDRQEILWDYPGNSLIRWVHYHRFTQASILEEGTYECMETFRRYSDTSRDLSGRDVIEIHAGGMVRASRFENGIPGSEFEGADWSMAGSCLIASQIRSRMYNDSLHTFNVWSNGGPDQERVFSFQETSRDSFQLWVPYRYDIYQDSAHWAHCRRLP